VPDRDVSTIRGLVYYQYAKIIAKSALAALGGESSLKDRGDKKFYDPILPLLDPPSLVEGIEIVVAMSRHYSDNGG